MTVVPNVKNPNSGLSLCRGYWQAAYTVDGKRRWRSMSTGDIKLARRRRNQFYAELLASGAEVSKPRGRSPGKPDEFRAYIHYRKPWVLKIAGREVGSFHTKEEAEAAKAAHAKNAKRPQ